MAETFATAELRLLFDFVVGSVDHLTLDLIKPDEGPATAHIGRDAYGIWTISPAQLGFTVGGSIGLLALARTVIWTRPVLSMVAALSKSVAVHRVMPPPERTQRVVTFDGELTRTPISYFCDPASQCHDQCQPWAVVDIPSAGSGSFARPAADGNATEGLPPGNRCEPGPSACVGILLHAP
jgi:hypothetical protein